MHKKLPYSKSAEDINKVSSPLTGHTFLGLIQVSAGSRFGFPLDRRRFCGVHLLNRAAKKPITELKAEAEDLEKDLNYLIVFKDTSKAEYIKRFATKEDALDWYLKCPPLHVTGNGTVHRIKEA